jgi:hypothetical protein
MVSSRKAEIPLALGPNLPRERLYLNANSIIPPFGPSHFPAQATSSSKNLMTLDLLARLSQRQGTAAGLIS